MCRNKNYDATTAGQHVEKSYLELQSTNSLIPRCFENTTCLTYDNYNVQQVVVRFATTDNLLRVPTLSTTSFGSSRMLTQMHLQPNHTQRATHSILHAHLPKIQTSHRMFTSVQSTPVNVSINPRPTPPKHGLGDEAPPVAASEHIGALRRNSETESLRNQNSKKLKICSS